MLQTGVSLMLQHILQVVSSVFSFSITDARFSDSSFGRFRRCITILSALRLPTPGKPDKACTAFSIFFDEKFKDANVKKSPFLFTF